VHRARHGADAGLSPCDCGEHDRRGKHPGVEKAPLQRLRQPALPADLFVGVPQELVRRYRLRVAPASTGGPRRHPLPVRAALVSAFCLARRREIAGTPVYRLILLAHTIGVQALSGDSTRVSVMVGIL